MQDNLFSKEKQIVLLEFHFAGRKIHKNNTNLERISDILEGGNMILVVLINERSVKNTD